MTRSRPPPLPSHCLIRRYTQQAFLRKPLTPLCLQLWPQKRQLLRHYSSTSFQYISSNTLNVTQKSDPQVSPCSIHYAFSPSIMKDSLPVFYIIKPNWELGWRKYWFNNPAGKVQVPDDEQITGGKAAFAENMGEVNTMTAKVQTTFCIYCWAVAKYRDRALPVFGVFFFLLSREDDIY